MKKTLFLVLAGLMLSSCASYKRLAYLQDMQPGVAYNVMQSPETRIGRDDILGIMVYSSQPELAAPFNVLPATVSDGGKTEGSTESYSTQVGIDYKVDSLGCINFPVLGNVYLEGMTLEEIMMSLSEKIKETGYVKDPIVKAEFRNFKIVVLGDANHKSIIDIPTGKVNIFELLAQAGDLTDDAQRDNVKVVRTVGDVRTVYSLNLKSKDVYYSPAFYLQQNDMVYIPPKNNKVDKHASDVKEMISWPFMIISTLISAAALVITLSRI